MGEYVEESGMCFGPFPSEALIRIEKIPDYTAIQKGMHISEFVYYDKQKQKLISLEAKTSAPNPNSEKTENPKENFRGFIYEMREKFENSLDLYLNMALKKNVPGDFCKIDYNKLEIIFILVVKNHQKQWLKDIKDAMEMAVRSIHRTNKIWKCKVMVLNEEMAVKFKLAVAEQSAE